MFLFSSAKVRQNFYMAKTFTSFVGRTDKYKSLLDFFKKRLSGCQNTDNQRLCNLFEVVKVVTRLRVRRLLTEEAPTSSHRRRYLRPSKAAHPDLGGTGFVARKRHLRKVTHKKFFRTIPNLLTRQPSNALV